MGWICVWDNDSDPRNDLYTDACWGSGNASTYSAYHDAWRVCGTPWETWVAYGMTENMPICPSATRIPWTHTDGTKGSYDIRDGKVNFLSGWLGDIVGTSYIVTAGINRKTCWTTYKKWSEIPPALGTMDKNPSSSLLACDGVWTDQFPDSSQPRYINHADPKDPLRPDYQGLLFGDGHVAPANPYPDGPLPEKAYSGTYRAELAATSTMIFFWEP
jgi:hypothetical protein